jgi:VanZ family protein
MTRPPSPGHTSRWRAILITALSAALVALLTLIPQPSAASDRRAAFTCLLGCHDQAVRDLLSNILLFLPLGWSLRHWLSVRRTVLLCLLATITIEALQFSVITGRDSSLRDILSNTAGGAIGAWLFAHWRGLCWPDRMGSLRLARLAAVAWAGVLLLAAAGIRPAPSDRAWYGEWTPLPDDSVRYPGQLLSLDIGGWAPLDGHLPEPVPLRQAMRLDSFLLRARVVSGPPPPESTPIYVVYDDDAEEEEQLFVGQDRRALVLRVRTWFDVCELRGLIVRLPLFPGNTPGDTVTVEAGLSGHSLFLRAVTATGRAEVRVPQTVGWGWASMLPFRYAIWNEWLLLNPLWLAGLILPVGYWFGRASPWAGLTVTTVALVAGLALVPLLADAAPTTHPEWAGGAGGAALGWAVGLWSRRQRPLPRPGVS